jgi:hypothetical protein
VSDRPAMHTLHLPVKLNDAYTCQGRDARGASIGFDDLLSEGERVATASRGDDQWGPYGVVVRRDDGLWIVAEEENADV